MTTAVSAFTAAQARRCVQRQPVERNAQQTYRRLELERIVENDATEWLEEIAVDDIVPSAYQPRSQVNSMHVESLAASIQSDGLLERVKVRPKESFFEGRRCHYELIDGEHRWRAHRTLGLPTIKAEVRVCTDEVAALLALVEFLRQDLSTMEEAKALRRLVVDMKYKHSDVAQRTGKSRSRVTNLIAITRLPDDLHPYIDDGSLSAKHAEHLLKLPGYLQIPVGVRAARERWSTRKLELTIERMLAPASQDERRDPNIEHLERGLSEHFCTTVQLVQRKEGKGGEVVFRFTDYEILEGILEKMGYQES